MLTDRAHTECVFRPESSSSDRFQPNEGMAGAIRSSSFQCCEECSTSSVMGPEAISKRFAPVLR